MKKLLAMLTALVMLCSMANIAFADEYNFEATVDWYDES